MKNWAKTWVPLLKYFPIGIRHIASRRRHLTQHNRLKAGKEYLSLFTPSGQNFYLLYLLLTDDENCMV